jgi:hypothetical protein
MLLGRLRCIDEYDIPNIANIEKIKNNNAAEWAGIPLGQFKKIYMEELRALLPKPEAAKPASGKQAKKKAGVRKCRVCGCTDDDCRGCIEKTGEPCRWVEEDLCSACVGVEKPAKKPAAGTAKKAAKKPAAKAMTGTLINSRRPAGSKKKITTVLERARAASAKAEKSIMRKKPQSADVVAQLASRSAGAVGAPSMEM